MAEQPILTVGTPKAVSLAGETRFTPNGIVSRVLFKTGSGRAVLFGFAEGQELTEHTSSQHALVQVLHGSCEFTLAGKLHNLNAGDLLYMPPHLPHAVKAKTDFSMLLTLLKPDAEAFPAIVAGASGTAASPAPAPFRGV
jgi:quercetin dioxygenase-like cupin family protein